MYYISEDDMPVGCRCHRCGDRYTVDLIVPDSIWRKIKPPHSTGSGGLLCGSCIMQLVENISGFSAWEIIKIE